LQKDAKEMLWKKFLREKFWNPFFPRNSEKKSAGKNVRKIVPWSILSILKVIFN
jgi:hypothetical protein